MNAPKPHAAAMAAAASRMVTVWDVACPTCAKPVNTACKFRSGIAWFHKARKDAAAAAYRAANGKTK